MDLVDPSPQHLQSLGTWGWDYGYGVGPWLSQPGPVCAEQLRVMLGSGTVSGVTGWDSTGHWPLLWEPGTGHVPWDKGLAGGLR